MKAQEYVYYEKTVTSPICERKNLEILEKKVLQVSATRPMKRYLDLGCGSGKLTRLVAQLTNAEEVHCVEISQAAIKQVSKLGICCRKLDLNKEYFPYPSNWFDLVTAFEVIEHLWNKDNVLEESFRVLKSGGFFILTTPNLLSFVNRILAVIGYLPMHYNLSIEYNLERRPFQRKSELYDHISLYTTRTLKRHLELVGFQVKAIEGLSLPYLNRSKILNFLNKILARRSSFAGDILLVAKKDI